MIRKIYRLKEADIKKVLRYKKPFFSYNLIANVSRNPLPYSRFALFLGGKNCKTSVSRNLFRRAFYDSVSEYTGRRGFDIVFVPKKGKVFDKKEKSTIVEFRKDVHFSLKKIFDNPQTSHHEKR